MGENEKRSLLRTIVKARKEAAETYREWRKAKREDKEDPYRLRLSEVLEIHKRAVRVHLYADLMGFAIGIHYPTDLRAALAEVGMLPVRAKAEKAA
ncbi:MAG: hypothetical protein JSU96_09175 [Acidobacteriota bacterium]|nr:MAG: hypothetical protein JSU96_09175 [Acidobacteriota bacterium]